MDAITTLFSQYSIESIIITLIAVAVAIKFLGELFDWFSKNLRTYFNVKNEDEEFKTKLLATVQKIENRQEEQVHIAEERDERLAKRIDDVQAGVDLLQERMQDSSRAYIIDKFHHYRDIGAIDDMGLNDLERRFMYYKSAGGDTFIDGLMAEIRDLPHLSAAQLKELQNKLLENGGKS